MPLASPFFSVTTASTLLSSKIVSSVFLTASLKVRVILLVSDTSSLPLAGLKVTVGTDSSVVKVTLAPPKELSNKSSRTPVPIATYTVCSLRKLLEGSTVMTVLASLTVALNGMSVPLASPFFSVTTASTLLSSKTVSSVFLTPSLKVMVILLASETSIAPLAGLNVTVGAVPS